MTLGITAVGWGADVALAHNSYDSSTPADGEVLTASPAEWVVTFTKDVPLASASAEIITADGVRADLPPAVAGSQANIIRFALPTALSGPVGLRWKLVSEDGHVVSGRVAFTVDAAAATTPGGPVTAPVAVDPVVEPSATPPSFDDTNPAPEPVRWFVRLAVYVALLMAVGLVVSELVIAQGTLRSARGTLLLRAAGGTLAVGSLIQLLVLLGDIHGTSILGSVGKLGDAFDSTALGMTTLRMFAGLAILWVAFTRVDEADEERVSKLLIGLLAAFAIGLAYTSHSRSRAWPVLGVPADAAHTAAVAVWLGGLTVLVFVIAPLVDDRDALETFRRFGRAATVAVPVVVGTGVVQTLRLHGGITTLISQSHGRLLLVKLLVVVVMLAVANKSRQLNLRRLTDEPVRMASRRRQLTQAGLTECAIGGVVVALTAALVTADFG
ncbi:MAG: copper resistance protein CopC [Ilumatobacteraceae bacterium]|nr:copper resistance protein CopC [Ilumatobacteraceae bacterium]